MRWLLLILLAVLPTCHAGGLRAEVCANTLCENVGRINAPTEPVKADIHAVAIPFSGNMIVSTFDPVPAPATTELLPAVGHAENPRRAGSSYIPDISDRHSPGKICTGHGSGKFSSMRI